MPAPRALKPVAGELDIGEVAQRAGVPASTLRFYEEKGLIASIGRNGLRRVFDACVLERLALIALGRSAGFSLEEIGAMLVDGGAPRIDRRRLSAKADELDRSIRTLTAMRDGLRHAAVCPARNHMECPKFLRILRVAAKGGIEPGGARGARGAAASIVTGRKTTKTASGRRKGV